MAVGLVFPNAKILLNGACVEVVELAERDGIGESGPETAEDKIRRHGESPILAGPTETPPEMGVTGRRPSRVGHRLCTAVAIPELIYFHFTGYPVHLDSLGLAHEKPSIANSDRGAGSPDYRTAPRGQRALCAKCRAPKCDSGLRHFSGRLRNTPKINKLR